MAPRHPVASLRSRNSGGGSHRRRRRRRRLSRSVKSQHPRLKKLIRYLGVLAPQSRGD